MSPEPACSCDSYTGQCEDCTQTENLFVDAQGLKYRSAIGVDAFVNAAMAELGPSCADVEVNRDVGPSTCEGQCHSGDMNVEDHRPAWLTESDDVTCPLCGHMPSATLHGESHGYLTFLIECENCVYDRAYQGEDALWAVDLFHEHVLA